MHFKRKNRIGFVDMLYFQEVGHQPDSVDGRQFVELESDDLPYIRRYDLTSEWVPLDIGWLKSVSIVHIENSEGRQTNSIPSEAQKLLTRSRVVEVGVLVSKDVVPIQEVRPTLWTRLFPVDFPSLRLRCRNKSARVNVRLYPA